ncbi:Two component regulator propeller [Symmachiella macrocystis]|uniref:Two component regulator propeller n=1 Tax=Symmachiella macrocystis TaxID=2527985 RepID=A0A5C6B9I0_9PLAN|nr:two-component regulator propeller domain-containing protein [Symmachiella macrocystis]TWU08610.1 Two component regulator propeller [Symmachiella macrocystis]
MHDNRTRPIFKRRDDQRQTRFPLLSVATCLIVTTTIAVTSHAGHNGNKGLGGVKSGRFLNDERQFFTTDDGLPSDVVSSIAVTTDGTVWAGTEAGLAQFSGDRFEPIAAAFQAVTHLTAWGGGVVFLMGDSIMSYKDGDLATVISLPPGWKDDVEVTCLGGGKSLLLGTTRGLYFRDGTEIKRFGRFRDIATDESQVFAIAVNNHGDLVLGTSTGLFERKRQESWERLHPGAGSYSWAPINVRGVAYDDQGRLWFACPQGMGVRTGGEWQLFTGVEGLPYDDFTSLATGKTETWLGTTIGAIRYHEGEWSYRRGLRWVPDDVIRDIAVSANGDTWFATAKGVGRIQQQVTSLAEKARFFEDEIDKYHRRTPFGFVMSVGLDEPGDKSHIKPHDSDNDGLWTSMYGAGECFAYAATKDPLAKQRATKAMLAMKFLSDVTQGGEHPAPHGFPARTVLPIEGRNPNDHDNRERDVAKQRDEDPLWKVIEPRWPVSADGKWYWKTDTSSDELDGHYFLYGLYYDLVAENEEEKAMVREVVARVTDHLIDHDFQLVDHDGKPTRWGRFSPKELNRDLNFSTGLRGINSLSMLSFLKVAVHVTGDNKYQQAYQTLVKEHLYATNTLLAKRQMGIGTGNQSDDEMAFMSYYGLINYEDDPELRMHYLISLMPYWKLVEAERNPLFNYIFASCFDTIESGTYRRKAPKSALEEALFTLRRYPRDRVGWGFRNSHRKDIVPLEGGWYEMWWKKWGQKKGLLRSGYTVPIDEHFLEFWNKDVWSLDEAGDGKTLCDGASFLLPYYMGLYHGFIVE